MYLKLGSCGPTMAQASAAGMWKAEKQKSTSVAESLLVDFASVTLVHYASKRRNLFLLFVAPQLVSSMAETLLNDQQLHPPTKLNPKPYFLTPTAPETPLSVYM